jgi:hypothetical protein
MRMLEGDAGVAKFGSMGWMAFLGLILPGEP